ncbi:hypothetical protein UT300009_24250 [Paraclostridium bifermentans]
MKCRCRFYIYTSLILTYYIFYFKGKRKVRGEVGKELKFEFFLYKIKKIKLNLKKVLTMLN